MVLYLTQPLHEGNVKNKLLMLNIVSLGITRSESALVNSTKYELGLIGTLRITDRII